MAMSNWDALVNEAEKQKKRTQTPTGGGMGTSGISGNSGVMGAKATRSTGGTTGATGGYQTINANTGMGYDKNTPGYKQWNQAQINQYGPAELRQETLDGEPMRMPEYTYTPKEPEPPEEETPPADVGTGNDYFAEKEALYQEMYNSTMAAANSAYNALRAEAERQAMLKKGYSNTRRITMEKYVPETLRAMGLMNSGLSADALIGMDANYTQYLLRALAEEEESKKAAAQYLSEQRRAADNQMAQWKLGLLDEEQSAWNTLVQLANEGANEETLKAYGKQYGFDEKQMGSVWEIYKQVAAEQAEDEALANKESEHTTMNSILQGGYSRAMAEQMARESGMSEAGVAQLLTWWDLLEADRVYTEQEQLFKAIQDEIITGAYPSESELQDYVTLGMLSQEQADQLLAFSTERQNTSGADSERVLSGREYVEYNGNEYQLKSKLSDNAKELTRNNDFKKQLKNLGFSNPYDKDIPNGTTLKIKADMTGANDFNFWDDIGKFVLGTGFGIDSWVNGHTLYLTFFNGEWYLSEKKS